MSAAKLSAVIQRRVIKILKTDLRDELNTYMPELEIDEQYTLKFLASEYNLSKSEADSALQHILSSLDSKFTRKKVPGKPNVFYPKGSKAKNKYAVFKTWKTTVSKELETKFGIKDFGQKFHLGHGNSSIPAVGYRALKAGKYLAGREGADAALGILHSSPLVKDVIIDCNTSTLLTKPGKFRKDLTVRIKLQTGAENLQDATLEKLENKKLIDELERIAVEEETSPSAIQTVSRALDDAIKGKKRPGKKAQSKARVTYKNKLRRQQGAKPAIRDSKGRFISAVSLAEIIDSQITEKVKENMREPALVNRTGRFAESVTVDRVTQSRQGTLTAFYSYMKYPYQTFERGFKQGSTRRDPRLLISKSIREIAQGIVSRKLNIRTRRV